MSSTVSSEPISRILSAKEVYVPRQSEADVTLLPCRGQYGTCILGVFQARDIDTGSEALVLEYVQNPARELPIDGEWIPIEPSFSTVEFRRKRFGNLDSAFIDEVVKIGLSTGKESLNWTWHEGNGGIFCFRFTRSPITQLR